MLLSSSDTRNTDASILAYKHRVLWKGLATEKSHHGNASIKGLIKLI